MAPKISIIIPTFNEIENIERVVNNANQIGDEVIVSDGGSTDGTLDRIRDLDCVLCNSPTGRGQQLAAGARKSDGDVLLFLHADNWLSPESTSQIVQAWSQSAGKTNRLFGCFRQRIMDDRFVFRLIETGNLLRARYQRLPYGDQGVFVSRELYESVGGIPAIPLMEDFEFSKTLSRSAKLHVLPGPIFVDARRWEKVGPIRQTLRNWSIAARYRLGATPDELMNRY